MLKHPYSQRCLAVLLRKSRESDRWARLLRCVLNRLKFFLKQRGGILLKFDHVSLFSDRLGLTGWALSNRDIQRIEVSLDGIFLANAVYGDSRADVKLVFPFVRQAEKSGFHLYADLPLDVESQAAEHEITVSAFSRDGRACEMQTRVKNVYDLWIRQNEPGRQELDAQQQRKSAYQPCISLITPAYNTPIHFLTEMLDSVLRQTYANWELCIADGASTQAHVKEILLEYAQRDARIKLRFLPENRGIAGNSNAALALAGGDFVGLLDHDDTLAPFALFEVARKLNQTPDVDYLYSDEDLLSEDGRLRYNPHFKPDWSPDTLRSTNYPTHFSVFRRSLLERLAGFRENFEGSQDYDLILRATEQARQIAHIPKVLYHWRMHDHSLARDPMSKQYVYDAAKRALQEHLTRLGMDGKVEQSELFGYYKVTYRLTRIPKISIIIPNHDHAEDLNRCVTSILCKSSYRNFEVLIVENGSRVRETFALYKKLKAHANVRVLTWNHPFNYSAINNWAATQARGEVLLFLNNDTEVITADWLERMLEHVQRSEVGAVGAKLYYPDSTIQHAGVIVGLGKIAGHCFRGFSSEDPGYMGRLKIIQNLSAVTAACLMVRKEVFRAVRGFEKKYCLAFNDVDVCLQIRAKGYFIVWTPYAELYHYESKTRGLDDTAEKTARFHQEKVLFQQKWQHTLEQGDPFYNPNLTLQREDFSINSVHSS